MPRKNIVVGLDLGTSKIVALVAEVEPEGVVEVIGLGQASSQGLRKGVIVDIEGTARAITEAAQRAERMSGVAVRSAFVGVGGPHVSVTANRGVVAVSGDNREITPEDAKRVLQAARVVSLPADRRIIHVLPREYIVDGYDGIIDPAGMAGSRLEVEARIISGAGAILQNTLKAVQKAGLEVEEFVINPLASAEAVLLPVEKELGAVLLDIGAGTTDIAIYERGSLWSAGVVPLGGEHVTGDLAIGLRTHINEAEELKKTEGCLFPELVSEEPSIVVRSVGGEREIRVSQKTVAGIIGPRVQELFSLVAAELHRSNYRGLLPGGLVLTGGGSLLSGIADLAGTQLNMPARVAGTVSVKGMTDLVSSPAYATVTGLCLYGARSLTFFPTALNRDSFFAGWLGRVRSWFREFF